MILSDSIKPAQLKAFAGIVDLYRDQHGRTIARSWPKARTTMHPNMSKTAARMTVMHSVLKNLHPNWLNSWQIPGMPKGRTKTDLARQNVLWQLQNLITPYYPTITTIGHAYDAWQDVHSLWFQTAQPYDWSSVPWQWHVSITNGPTFEPPRFYQTNQLFRRGDPSLMRPLLANPTTWNFQTEDDPVWSNWHMIPIGAAEHSDFTGFLQPFWTGTIPPAPRTSSRSCYAPAPYPLPLAGIKPFGLSFTGSFPWD